MTVDSSMSSGYCSLDEELEDCFFTAKTTFFRNAQSKHLSKKGNLAPSKGTKPHVRKVARHFPGAFSDLHCSTGQTSSQQFRPQISSKWLSRM
ncbi:hypothetical protein P7K49_035828 [Saguinus oedipus]|uniref:Uncharacterized protein n=1 Tax=Saguinus oedipus TaxID=9490 RepID=A0ABQ9TNS7_SAGOE|nr:hypothetical protein P7K49_035828 [Saguinus oedipus]